MEPLQLLREWGIAGKTPTLEGDYYVFGKKRLHKQTLTAWRDSQKNVFLPLIVLERCLRYRDELQGTYVRLAADREANFLSYVERRTVLSYLTGEIDTAEQIQVGSAPSAAPATAAAPALQPAPAPEHTAAGNMQELRQRHAEQLEATAAYGARAGLLPADAVARGTDGSGLSSEKLLELRSKARLNKRQTILGEKDAEGAAALDPALLVYDREPMKRICEQEVRVADRNSVLCWPGRDFTFALNHYTEMRRHERERESANDDGSYGKKRSRSGGSGGSSAGSGGENRDRHAPPGASGTASLSSSRGPYLPGSSGSSGGSGGGKPSSSSSSRSRSGAPAIIIVPNTPTSMITLYNVKRLLEEGYYEASQAAKERLEKEGGRKPTSVKLERTLHNGQKMVYEIIDNPIRLYPQDWERVVCVVVQGAAWQFKNWQWEQPVTLFQRVLGVYLKFDDVKTDKAVTQWNVRILEVNKYKRHLDIGASKEFWRLLDEFILVYKSYLLKGS